MEVRGNSNIMNANALTVKGQWEVTMNCYCSQSECVDESGGVSGILLESLKACNHDVRLKAAQHIVIIGGGAMIPGECCSAYE